MTKPFTLLLVLSDSVTVYVCTLSFPGDVIHLVLRSSLPQNITALPGGDPCVQFQNYSRSHLHRQANTPKWPIACTVYLCTNILHVELYNLPSDK